MSILAAWVLPTKLGLFAGGKDSYDPDAYPLDTTLDSILPQSAADDAYITASVFAGDQYAVTLQKDTRITLNQFVGAGGIADFQGAVHLLCKLCIGRQQLHDPAGHP